MDHHRRTAQRGPSAPGLLPASRGLLTSLLAATCALWPCAAASAQGQPMPGTGVGPVAGSAFADPSAQVAVTVRSVTIPAPDGTPLAADVYQPADRAAGPIPLLVMPGAWFSLPQDNVLSHARALAGAGYAVISYDPRGFRGSGGEIDMAGPTDVRDASEVISWALRYTGADPGRIGLVSSSYGAGVSLNTAAQDPRVRTVVALNGWTNLIEGFYRDGTRAAVVATFQDVVGRLNGRPSAADRAAFDRLRNGGDPRELLAWARPRSPMTHVGRINAHHTTVMLVNEWSDPLVPAGQTGAFFDALTGPKRLQMHPGGHGDSNAAEADLLLPRAHVWDSALDWLDNQLKGRRNGVEAQGPVLIQSRTGGDLESYPSWSALTDGSRAVPLEAPWADAPAIRLETGLDSAADSGLFPVAGKLDQAGLPPTTLLPLLLPPVAAVWWSAQLDRPWALRGAAGVRTTVTPSAPDGTFITHLYDVDPLGIARLLSHTPYSFAGQRPGRPLPVSLMLPATAWDIPAGHRLAVAIDTVDLRYATENPSGATLDFDAARTTLTVPVEPTRLRFHGAGEVP